MKRNVIIYNWNIYRIQCETKTLGKNERNDIKLKIRDSFSKMDLQNQWVAPLTEQ